MSTEIVENKAVLSGDYSLTEYCGPATLSDRMCLQLTVIESFVGEAARVPGIAFCSMTRDDVTELRAELDAWLVSRAPAEPPVPTGEVERAIERRVSVEGRWVAGHPERPYPYSQAMRQEDIDALSLIASLRADNARLTEEAREWLGKEKQ